MPLTTVGVNAILQRTYVTKPDEYLFVTSFVSLSVTVHFLYTYIMKFSAAFVALIGGAAAFAPSKFGARPSTAVYNLEKGAGGMFDTRNPDALKHEDPRKSISEAPSFEEYMKMRSGGAAAPAPAPAAPAPAAYSPPAPAPMSYSPPAPAPAPAAHSGAPVKGAGGMFDTRDPTPVKHEDPRKSISEAPSFEEYMKQRASMGQ